MKRLVAFAAVLVMALAGSVQAKTIVRDGSDYNGYANPNGCEIFVHDDKPTELHVKCTQGVGATGKARIRYRFLRDVGAQFRPADVSADIKINGGDNCNASNVRWMVPIPRTVRIIVPFRCYVHIRSVTWRQQPSG